MSLPDGRKVNSLKVNELRLELEQRGLGKSGNKKDLIERLEKSIEDEDSPEMNEESDVKAESENDDDGNLPKNPEMNQQEVANSEESNEVYQQNDSNDGASETKMEEAASESESAVEDQPMKVEPDQSENQETEDMEADSEPQPRADDEQVSVEDRQEEDEAEADVLQGNVSDDEAITGEIDSSEIRGVPPKDLERFEAEHAQTSEVTTSTKIEEGDNDELEEGEMRDDDDEADSSSKGNAEVSQVSQGTASDRAASTSSVTSTRKRQWGIRRPSAKAYVELSLSSQSLNNLVDVTSTSANSEGDLRNDGQTLTLPAIAENDKETSNRVTRLVTVEDDEGEEAMEEGEVPATPLSGDPLMTGSVLHTKSSIHEDEDSPETSAADRIDSKKREIMEEAAQNVAIVTVEIPRTSMNQESEGDAQTKPSSPHKTKKKGLRETRAVGYHVEDPVRGREVEAPSQSASDTVQIRGLVRPFTLNQLKDLLSRYGSIKKFWIDRVKSKSFIQFQAADEAASAREGLDGCKWPSINPRLLRVDFSSEEELDWMVQNGESGRPYPRVQPPAPRPAQTATERPSHTESSVDKDKESSSRDRDRHRERQRHKEDGDGEQKRRKSGEGSRKTVAPPIREWDRDKVKQSESPPPARRQKRRSRSRSPMTAASREKTKGAEPKEETKDKRKEEAAPTTPAPTPAKEEPARLLDDLFRKTKVLPSIYWLPLSEEQVKQRQREREERAKARQQRPKVSPHGPGNKGSSSATGSRQTAQSERRRSRSRDRRRDWDPRRR